MSAVWPWHASIVLRFCAGVIAFGGHLTTGLRELQETGALDSIFVVLVWDIGLEPGATVSLKLTNRVPSNGTVAVILTRSQWDAWTSKGIKIIPGPSHSYSSYLVSHWRSPFRETLVEELRIVAPAPERYTIGVLNVHRHVMMLTADITYTNPGGNPLPYQLAHTPQFLWCATVAFVALMLVIVLLLMLAWPRSTSLLHGILVGCLWLKSSTLALKWRYFDLLLKEGQAPSWRLQIWQMGDKLHTICKILLLLMTALGWRVLRQRLAMMELRFTVLALLSALTLAILQVFGNFSTEPIMSLTLFFYIVRVVCYLVIIFAMNFNLQLIALHLVESPVTPTVALLYQKQQVYAQFRLIFLAIVFQPSVLMWLQVSVLNAEGTQWAAHALYEASAWIIYAALFATLRPGPMRPHLLRLMRTVTAAGESAAGEDVLVPEGTEVAQGSDVVEGEGSSNEGAEQENTRTDESLDDTLITPYVPLLDDE